MYKRCEQMIIIIYYRVTAGSSSLSRSSWVWMTFCTSVMKSSNPLSNMVSLHPLWARHDGHVLMSASGPLYHSFTHFSQPTTILQHLLIMIGGVIGTKRQILHLSMSCNYRCRPGGILAFLFRVNISLIAFLSSPTSSMSTFSFFSRTLYPDSFAFGLHRHLR